MFVMWLGEKITDRGIGNGISLIITVGILARMPGAFFQEAGSRFNKSGGLFVFIVEIAVLIAVILAIILLVQGTRRIPIQYAKRIVGNKQFMGARQFLPIKINSAGVMPIIFAQALMFLPSLLGQAFPDASWAQSLTNGNYVFSFGYNIVFFFLIIIFCYFYTAMIINPMQISDDLKRNGGFIPGIKPGTKTAEFIDSVISRITLPGAIFLGIVAVFPTFAQAAGVSQNFANFFGGTSILIMVGTVLDTLQQIENELLTRHYDGLMKSGRIKGRQVAPVSIAQG
jgi:preprotein translocase subunit SecY